MKKARTSSSKRHDLLVLAVGCPVLLVLSVASSVYGPAVFNLPAFTAPVGVAVAALAAIVTLGVLIVSLLRPQPTPHPQLTNAEILSGVVANAVSHLPTLIDDGSFPIAAGEFEALVSLQPHVGLAEQAEIDLARNGAEAPFPELGVIEPFADVAPTSPAGT